ncbi:MAG: hypothetical protein ABIZ52_07545 [Candidatus Limnocylindrales bacterium]
MSRHRWSIWLGPPVALVAIALVVGQFQPGAEAGGRVTPRPAGVCANTAPELRGLHAAKGTWWRLVDRLDANGALVGRTLFAGKGGAANLTLELGAESSASGPVGGMVVVATDDGTFSEVRLVAAAEGCSWLIHRSQDVVRSAILDSPGGVLLAHLVTRETREDEGIWRIGGMDPDATLERVLGPLPAQPAFGPVWATELRLNTTGTELAVQSCGEGACVVRVVSLKADNIGGAAAIVGGSDQGAIIGFSGERLITWAHCQGLPCALQAWTAGASKPTTLVDLAAGAALTGDGHYLVVVLDETGRAARVDLGNGAAQRVRGVAAGDLPLSAGIGAYAGFEVGADEVAINALGADPHAFSPAEAALAP